MAGPNVNTGDTLKVLAGNQTDNIILGTLSVEGDTTFSTDVSIQRLRHQMGRVSPSR